MITAYFDITLGPAPNLKGLLSLMMSKSSWCFLMRFICGRIHFSPATVRAQHLSLSATKVRLLGTALP